MKPFLPFTRPSIDADSMAAVSDVLRSGQLASGPKVKAFEAALEAYHAPGRHVRVMTSATAGLEMALEVAGVCDGHEVIVPAMSFAASANVIARVRATPKFVDIELHSRNINVDLIEAAITARTRAIMPVHFAGCAVDQDALYSIAERHGLRVIEDAAHAIGTRYRGRLIGSFGDLVVFSFHPNKNMTSIEGGAISTSDAKTADCLEQYRFHGIKRNARGEIDVLFPGAKSNLSDVAAQIGLDQLRRLDGFNTRRRALADRYFDELADFDEVVLPARGDAGHSWHMFQVLIDFPAHGMTRPEFQARMADQGIGIGVHYPSIPSLTYYVNQGYRSEDTPVAARVGRETVTLPLFPAMSDEDVSRVCRELRELLRKSASARSCHGLTEGRYKSNPSAGRSRSIAFIGECMVQLAGNALGDLRQSFGGDTLNSAVYFARLARDVVTQYVTVLGTDELSDAMVRQWQDEGIDTSLVLRDASRLPGLYQILTEPNGERRFLYWRGNSAARFLLQHPDIDRVAEELHAIDVIYLSGITLAILPPPDRLRLLDLLRALSRREIPIAFDPNYRPALWACAEDARECIGALLPSASVMFATLEDEEKLWGDRSPQEALERFAAAGVPSTIIKLGAGGCLYSDGSSDTVVPAVPVASVVDTTAAGDSFNAAYLAAWMGGAAPLDCCGAGNALAGIVIQHAGAIIPAEKTPSLDQLGLRSPES